MKYFYAKYLKNILSNLLQISDYSIKAKNPIQTSSSVRFLCGPLRNGEINGSEGLNSLRNP